LGNIYLTWESFTDNNTYRDISVVKFDSTANHKWQTTYSGCSGIDRGYAVAVNDLDEIFIAGEANYNFFVIKYKQSTTSVETNTVTPINDFYLSQNYPNPFNPSTIIIYHLPKAANVELKVYDVLGNEIATLVDEEKPAGNYIVEFNSSRHSCENGNLTSGIYFYQLKAGDYLETKKMILLR